MAVTTKDPLILLMTELTGILAVIMPTTNRGWFVLEKEMMTRKKSVDNYIIMPLYDGKMLSLTSPGELLEQVVGVYC